MGDMVYSCLFFVFNPTFHMYQQVQPTVAALGQVNGQKHTAKYICVATGGRAQRLPGSAAIAVSGFRRKRRRCLDEKWIRYISDCGCYINLKMINCLGF